jgi:hypothetical protein
MSMAFESMDNQRVAEMHTIELADANRTALQ